MTMIISHKDLFISFLDGLPLARFLALHKLRLVQLCVHPQRLQLIPWQPLPGSFRVKEQDEIVGPER